MSVEAAKTEYREPIQLLKSSQQVGASPNNLVIVSFPIESREPRMKPGTFLLLVKRHETYFGLQWKCVLVFPHILLHREIASNQYQQLARLASMSWGGCRRKSIRYRRVTKKTCRSPRVF